MYITVLAVNSSLFYFILLYSTLFKKRLNLTLGETGASWYILPCTCSVS